MSWDMIALVAGGYAFLLLLILSLLTASKRGEHEAHRAVAQERARERGKREGDRRDAA
jgi:hypothetical protein